GTARGDASGNSGTVYKVNTDGTGFTIIYNFNGIRSKEDGAMPLGDLILSDNTLFGTTSWGGRLGHGTVFKINIDGTGFTTLHDFTGSKEGRVPVAGLTLSGTILYGTTFEGGLFGDGTV